MQTAAASGVDARGLTADEVAARIARGQSNRERGSAWRDYADIVVRNLFTLFNALVVPAAAALALLGEYRGAIAVSGMALANTALALAQEARARWHLGRLALLTEARARVLRDGTVCPVLAGEVVLDDLVLLAAGEQAVADGRVVSARYLEMDEALLTGESDPVARRPGDPILSGSVCVAGDGMYRVERAGGGSFAQRTAAEARRHRRTPSPFQRAIDLLIRILTGTALALCALYVLLYLTRGFPVTDLVQMVAATITSLVPQGLVLMTTLAFTLAALRLSRRGALVQRLNAVEAMASVDVLCMDKTGTLTTGRLRLDRVVVLGGADEEGARAWLRDLAWLSVDERNKSIQALRAGLGERPPGRAAEALDQLPFKSQNRASALRVREDGGAERIFVLGACEALRPRLAPGEEAGWEAAWRELLPTGLRLLLFAEADGAGAAPFGGEMPDVALRPLALVALSDELRGEAPAVLSELAGQGIGLKILSGDHAETVRATAARLDLPLAHGPVASGDDLAASPDPGGLIGTRAVFGRISPQQKLDIVSRLQEGGACVAMLGDGVNDLLPIKRADLGVAMGEGSPATKAVAGLVLEDNDFRLLPAALEEGRALLHALQRAARILLLKNVYTLFLILVGAGVLGLPFPYLPQQVTLLNALTIGGPVLLVVGLGAPGPAPRAGRRWLLAEAGRFAVASGLVIGVAGLAVLLLSARALGDDIPTQRTLLLSTLILLGLAALFRLDAGRPAPASSDLPLHVWAALAVPLYGLVMYWPAAADFFQLVPLDAVRWGLVVAVLVAASAAARLVDRWGG